MYTPDACGSSQRHPEARPEASEPQGLKRYQQSKRNSTTLFWIGVAAPLGQGSGKDHGD
jgi:hypothetical protein